MLVRINSIRYRKVNLTNVVLNYEKDKNKALFKVELTKKENERLRTELNTMFNIINKK